jgi:protein subunit release factor B
MSRELVFSVTAADCTFKFTRGTGNGGQKKNKTNSACHCKHPPSGAAGYAEDSRSQRQNKELAFARMCERPEFKTWLSMQFRIRTGQQAVIESNVERQMRQIRVEVKDEGLWTPVDKDATLPDVDA